MDIFHKQLIIFTTVILAVSRFQDYSNLDHGYRKINHVCYNGAVTRI